MPLYRYGVFYRYVGPSHSDPLRDELSADQVEHNLHRFPQELSNYLDDVEFTLESARDVEGFPLVVGVECELAKDDVDEAVKKCLIGLELMGKKL